MGEGFGRRPIYQGENPAGIAVTVRGNTVWSAIRSVSHVRARAKYRRIAECEDDYDRKNFGGIGEMRH